MNIFFESNREIYNLLKEAHGALNEWDGNDEIKTKLQNKLQPKFSIHFYHGAFHIPEHIMKMGNPNSLDELLTFQNCLIREKICNTMIVSLSDDRAVLWLDKNGKFNQR